MMSRANWWVTSAAAMSTLVAITGLMAIASPSSATETPAADSTFLLAIGASVSVGVQPTPRSTYGQPTNQGYANDLVAMWAKEGTAEHLIQTGCPGETTQQVLLGGDHCYAPGESQLRRAVAFLRTHANQSGVVTLDLGFNNLHGCVHYRNFDTTCVNARMNLLRFELNQIIAVLKSVAGPHVTFVGINHYNPYLAAALTSSTGSAFADASVPVIDLLNSTLATIYSQNSIPVADVAASFRTSDETRVRVGGIGVVGENLAQICALTWMCHGAPTGPNLHPNDKGYQVIADAIAALLPR